MISSFEDLKNLVSHFPPKRAAIAGVGSVVPFQAMDLIKAVNGTTGTFIGDRAVMERLDLSGDWSIIHEPDELLAARKAVRLVVDGQADLVVKGSCATSEFMRACLDRTNGLKTDKLLAQIFGFITPYSHGLKLMSDGAVTIKPGPAEKAAMIENAVPLARALGSDRPKVALVCALEKPTPKLVDTMDAAEVAAQSERWQALGCDVDGPLSIDCALDPESAAAKGMASSVAGKAEILIFPDLGAANIFAKGIAYLANAQSGAIVLGGSAPIVLRSRSDTVAEKFNSILLGILAAEKIFSR